MIDYQNLQHQLIACHQPDWAEQLATELDDILSKNKNSRLPEWTEILASLEPFKTTSIDLSGAATINSGAASVAPLA